MSATNRGSIRRPQDFYPTPDYCIDLLLPYIDLRRVHRFLEPCRGAGVIYDRIPAQHKEWCEISDGRDHLTARFIERFDLILTNPPFSLLLPFLEKSLSEASTVIYLLPLNALGSQCRCEFWNQNKPTHQFVISERPSFIKDGKTDQCNYAWFIWDRGGLVKSAHWFQVLSKKAPCNVSETISCNAKQLLPLHGVRSPNQCDHCGSVIVAVRATRKYCGTRCRVAAHRSKAVRGSSCEQVGVL